MDKAHNHHKYQGTDGPTAAKLIKQLSQFDGSFGEFLWDLLAVECYLGRADCGAILRSSQDKGVDVLAIYPGLPDSRTAPAWLTESAPSVREAISTEATVIKSLPDPDEHLGKAGNGRVLFVPLKMAEIGQAVEAFVIRASDKNTIKTHQERLELTAKLVGIFDSRVPLQKTKAQLVRLQRAMETLSAINQQNRFRGVAMALCNEVAAQWRCERVSIGFLKGRYVRLEAMSHTEHFGRKMKVVQDIESAMEECLDQDCEILYPPLEEATCISRAAGELSRLHGPVSVLSVPLRRDGEVRAVLTLERPADKSFALEEVEVIRLVCELCTARLLSLYEHDRWFGARAAAKARSVLAAAIGPRHTWKKLLAILILGAILFLIFGKGQFRAEAPFVLEATYQQVVCASFDGYIKGVNVEVGDMANGNETILAELDTAELRLQLAAAKAEKARYLKQVAAAMRDGETAQAQIAQADADKAEAQIELLNYMINQGKVVSPITGTVVKGDLKRQIGAPVKKGDILFEITPLESLRAELLMPEDQVFDIAADQEGYLATVSYPAQRIKFVVERINPMAEVVNNRNVFKVRVRLLEIRPWMRPGMEGVAKVSVGRRRYIWIWTRRIVNWLRMKFWL